MKKLILFILALIPAHAFAQISYVEEAKQLGFIAGQGKICKASKQRTFEMLSHAIILSKASTTQERDSALKAFVEQKVRGYQFSKQDCPEILSVFDNQEIFKIKLYEDGTLQMPDKTIITPKIPYDATKI